jgi:hypothetical protein
VNVVLAVSVLLVLVSVGLSVSFYLDGALLQAGCWLVVAVFGVASGVVGRDQGPIRV